MRGLAAMALALAVMAGACAPTLPRAYLEAHAAADRAHNAGRHEEAARKYHEAALAADRIKDRDEMLYLEAASYERAGRHQDATQRYRALIELSPDGPRSARSSYELADVEIDRGDAETGFKMLEESLRKYPDAGVARHALQRLVRRIASQRGDDAAIAWLRQNMSWLRGKGPGESASYLLADRLEAKGDLQAARDGFVQTARNYPYPSGSLFDDSLYRASQLDEKLGDPKRAVERLRELLSFREPSTMNGSYERPRYAQAQMRIAELYRDALGDQAAARREFRKLFEQHTTSLMRDDALWQEALIARRSGDADGACGAARLLVLKLPESRYAACAQLVCESAPKPEKAGKCRDYVARELEPATGKGTDAAGP